MVAVACWLPATQKARPWLPRTSEELCAAQERFREHVPCVTAPAENSDNNLAAAVVVAAVSRVVGV